MDDNSEILRTKAKEELRQGKIIDTSLYETDMKVLVEELSIYQIELEHQNQELILSQEKLQESNDRYLDLFDNAPIGYLIVNSIGIIKDINQTACKLLEYNKTEIVDTKISKIIHPDFQDIYLIYFRALNNQKNNRTCDIKLRKATNSFFYGRIQGVCQTPEIDSDPEFRLAISDISSQKEMEIKLLAAKALTEESEERLKVLFDDAPDAMLLADPETGKIIDANNKACSLFKKQKHELIGLLQYELHPRQNEGISKNSFKEHFENPEHNNEPVENRICCSDGSEIPVEIVGQAIQLDGKLLMLGTFRDITERKKAEEALRRSEAIKNKMVSNIGDVIVIIDQKRINQYKSPNVTTLFGWEPHELVGKSIWDTVHPDDLEAGKKFIATIAAEPNATGTTELRYKRKDGIYVWIRITLMNLFADPDIKGLLGNYHDITENKQTQAALEKRLVALTQPLENTSEINFEDLFNLADIQLLQDDFAHATGIASIITRPDGTPITKPSNFTNLCQNIIRKSEKGLANCINSDAKLGKPGNNGCTIQTCFSAGLWDGGAPITVGGHHIANWMIGQVRNVKQTDEKMRAYAREIGVNEEEAIEAFNAVTSMTLEQFEKIGRSLFTLSNQLSTIAYQNIQQARFITDRTKAEDALKNSKDKITEERKLLRTLIDNLPDYIYVKDVEGRKIISNIADYSVLGLKTEDQIIGKTDLELFPNEMGKRGYDYDMSVITTGKAIMWNEEDFVNSDGTRRWVLTTKTPLYDANEKIIGLVGIGHDITKNKQAEFALRESEEKLSTLFNSMTEMVVMHELVFDENGEAIDYRILNCNKTFCEITGIEKENAVGQLATEVYGIEKAPYLQEYANVALNSISFEFSTYYPPLDKYFLISVVPSGKNRFSTISTDITSSEQIHEIIKEKNKELENYIYVASHDLRSPLVNIQGFSQRLQKQTTELAKLVDKMNTNAEIAAEYSKIAIDDIPKSLSFILNNVGKMDILINGLLQVSRTGRVVMNPSLLDANKLFKSILIIFDYQLKEIDANVNVHELDDCFGDVNQLNQLFSNIIGNAIKYRDKNRNLTLEISSQTKYNKVIYSIKDNGIGINERHLLKIWDVFYRVDASAAEAGEGLGLSLARRIVDKHKGKMWAESVEGEGSTFYIELQKNRFEE